MPLANPESAELPVVRKLAAIWTLLMVVLVAAAAIALPDIQFETNILELLPHKEKNPLVLKAQEKQNSVLNQSVIWLAGGKDQQTAFSNARVLEEELKASGLFAEIHLRWNGEDAINSYQAFLPYRYNFITAEDKAGIIADAGGFAANSIELLYSPLGMQHAATLLQDPLFTLGGYINSLSNNDIELYQDVAMLTQGNTVYALLLSKTAGSDIQTDRHNRLIDLYEVARERFNNDGNTLLVAGMPLYSAYGAQSAEHEISTIGSVSTIAVILLVIFAFRSIRPLILSLLSISIGIFAALTVSTLLFERVHIITLVFGSSLIGCIDYSFHYFCNSFQQGWTSWQGMKNIFTSIGLGMLGSVIAFLSLAFTPFPGLQQIAIFSATGLFAAWLTVILLFPLWSRHFSCRHPIPLTRFYPVYLDQWPALCKKYRVLFIALGLVLLVGGFSQLNIQDDIRSMQKADPLLLEQENSIKAIFRQKHDSQYFIVSGKTADEVIHKEKQLLAQLEKPLHNKQLESYVALGQVYASTTEQLANRQLLATVFFDSGKVRDLFHNINMADEHISSIYAELDALPPATLPLEQWLAAVPKNWQQQWLGCENGQCASIVNLKGIRDLAVLQALAPAGSGIYFVDNVATINGIMHEYRIIAGIFVGIAAVVITLMLCYPLGIRAALTIISIPLTAIMLTVAITGFIGTVFNLFNVFALILVLGIGFDYSIFHYLGNEHKQSTSLAVLLSLLTTTLSFGLLTLSKTTVIQSFGLTLSIGIALAFLLSPLISSVKKIEVSHE